MPSVSVLIPAFNRGSTVDTTIRSLLDQSWQDWEAIVVDDGSADGTAEVVSTYAARDPRIRLERQTHGGVSAARNVALKLARGAWTLFLDADDWLARDALLLLYDALARHGRAADAAWGQFIAVLPDGSEMPERRVFADGEALFLAFAQRCAFPIHTCLVRTELVRRVGGFDVSLATCEDWDLWQRVARTGACFVGIPDPVAYYRIRADSASRDAVQLLADGLVVIARGHGDDPRLERWPDSLRHGRSPVLESGARLGFAAYAAGLRIAAGEDARPLLDGIPSGQPGQLDAEIFAETLHYAVVAGRAAPPAAWTTFPASFQTLLDAFVDAMAEKVGDNWLAQATRHALERLVVQHADGGETLIIGATQRLRLDFGAPMRDERLHAMARRVLLDLHAGVERLGSVLMPAVDGVLPAAVAADALADELGWRALREFFARTVYRSLVSERVGGRLLVRRGGVLLADEAIADGKTELELIHDAVGWTVFLQELWGLQSWDGQRFYSRKRRAQPQRGLLLAAAGGVSTVELSLRLPRILSRRTRVPVLVTLAGVPFMVLSVPTTAGMVAPDALRLAVTTECGYELLVLSVREALLRGRWDDDVPLRSRLADAASRRGVSAGSRGVSASATPPASQAESLLDELVPAGRRAVVIGRRESAGTQAGGRRTVQIPWSSSAAAADSARRREQLVAEHGRAGRADLALYAPCIFDPYAVARERRSITVRGGPGEAARARTMLLPILMYHHVRNTAPRSAERWSISVHEFEEQLALLKDNGFASISITEWATNGGAEGHGVPGRRVVLTFDDGYDDFAETALPLLERYGLCAELFVVSGHVGGTNAWEKGPGRSEALMDWGTLAALPPGVVRIGSHTHRHEMLAGRPSDMVMDELLTSRLALEDRLGRAVTTLAYPYGLADGATERLAVAAGYDYAYTGVPSLVYPGRNLLRLPRIECRPGVALSELSTLLGIRGDGSAPAG